jgi:deoxyribodipyrimidine photo-lyase
MASIFWFRRDLRLEDHPALNLAIESAVADGDGVVYGLVSDNDYTNLSTLSPIRQESMYASWRALDEQLGEGLSRVADALETIISSAQALNTNTVFVSAAYDPLSVAFMTAARQKLEAAGLKLVVGAGNYAVAPGKVVKPDGTPYRVYTPFFKAWFEQANQEPAAVAAGGVFKRIDAHLGFDSPAYPASFQGIATDLEQLGRVRAGQEFATQTFESFRRRGALFAYQEQRNRADLSGTSHLSHALAHGEVHPRSLLAQLGSSPDETTFAKELAWREFYADVLWHNPSSLNEYLQSRFADMRYDDGTEIGESRLEAWKAGRTGYPMVDAGMRQLLSDGWVHNRVRMIVASFLVKDLHIEWQRGADWFEHWLTDFDPASNAHGWQWTAGCGTDASPYYRVFNPILQGLKFDPNGDYVRKYVPELAHIEGAAVHEPWLLVDGLAKGYPAPIVDHSDERAESLARLADIKVD